MCGAAAAAAAQAKTMSAARTHDTMMMRWDLVRLLNIMWHISLPVCEPRRRSFIYEFVCVCGVFVWFYLYMRSNTPAPHTRTKNPLLLFE